MKTPHRALTLRANTISEEIVISDGLLKFDPKWGGQDAPSALATSNVDGKLTTVYVAKTNHGVFITPCTGQQPQKELVLVQQYCPGCGAKRWPCFEAKMNDEVQILSSAATRGGSGYENWTLVSAPLGWAENIAHQVINVRDGPDQVISYKKPEETTLGVFWPKNKRRISM